MQDRALTRGQARRLSRRFGDVGVAIPATRLRQIAAGASARDDELTDVSFAIAATQIQVEQRLAKLKRHQRRVVRWLIVAGLVLLLLNSLMCMAYLFFSMTLHAYPY
jgi:predicted ferric reductase